MSELRNHPGVESADLNYPLSRVVVSLSDGGAPSVRELCGLVERAEAAGIESLVIAGDIARNSRIDALSLVGSYGPERALAQPAECLMELVETSLAGRPI